MALWAATEGGLHSFNHWDDEDEEWVEVRFEGRCARATSPAPFKIDTVTLVEVR
jgi:hypothetical protein